MIDRDQPPSSEDEIRRAVFGQVDLHTAELEIVSSIYDGFAAAITVKGQPRTIALTREYGDAVQLMAMIERSRSAQPAASEAGAAAGEGPQPVRGEIRVIDGNRCRFIERELEGDKWEVIGPAAASDSETNEMAALRALPQAREDAQPVAWIMRHMFGNDAWSNWTVVSETVARSHMRDHAFKIGRKQVIAVRDIPPAPDALRVAVSDIAAERQRQVDAEGWSAERDDEYTDRSLAHAAAAYALGFDLETRAEFITEDVSGGRGETPVWKNRQIQVPASWPSSWDARWWKPTDLRRDLVKAGALIVAEIERLDRAALQAEQKGGA